MHYPDKQAVRHKVVHVIGDLWVGGAETMLYKLLVATNNSKVENIVISLKDRGVYGEKLEKLGIDVYTLELKSGALSLSGFKHLITLLRDLEPDIVQSWMYHANIATTLANLFLHIPVIWNIRHSLHDMSSEKKMTRLLIRGGWFLSALPSKIIFNSAESLAQHQKLGYSKSKLRLIPNGFDLTVYQPSTTARQTLLDTLSLSQDQQLIGVVARYHKAKGYKYFVEAAKKIAEQSANVHFVLIGKSVDCHNDELNAWIASTNCPERFHLMGIQHEVNKIIPAFTLLVNPSTTEAFPNVIGEAMACEVPCVVTDVGDSRNIVGDYGAVVPAQDSVALSQSVLAMLSLGEAELKLMGNKARKRIMENYSINAVAKQYEALYKQCSELA